MRTSFHLLILFLLLGLAACSNNTRPDIGVKPEFWNDKNIKVGIAVLKAPLPATHKGGQQGLLDMAINNSMAGELETHLNSVDVSDLSNITSKIAKYLETKNIIIKTIDEQIDASLLAETDKSKSGNDYYAGRDYRSLKQLYDIDKLVLVSVVRSGTQRNYYGFVPTSDPVGLSHVNGKIINLNNNTLEWNQKVIQEIAIVGEWDVPPTYEGLTQAVHEAHAQSQVLLYNYFVQ